jgi:hypothetical protein
MPGADEAIKAAANGGDWAAVLLVVMVVGVCGLFGWMIRQLWLGQEETQKFIRGELANVIDDNTVGWSRAASVLAKRPCLLDEDASLLAGNGTRDEDPSGLDETARRAIKRRQARSETKIG